MQPVNYSTLTFDKRHKVLEKLPVSVVKSIIAYVARTGSIQQDVLRIKGTSPRIPSDVYVDITVDSTLFPIE
jgi:hypothetical protein